MTGSDLQDLVTRLEEAAARLRAGELDPAEAARLVEQCAESAGAVASEVDRQVRELEADQPDQETLL